MAEAVGAGDHQRAARSGAGASVSSASKESLDPTVAAWTFWLRFLPGRCDISRAPAAAVLMNFLTTALAPSTNLLVEGALLIDADGRAVKGDLATIPTTVAGAPGNQAWLILDAPSPRSFKRCRFTSRLHRELPTPI